MAIRKCVRKLFENVMPIKNNMFPGKTGIFPPFCTSKYHVLACLDVITQFIMHLYEIVSHSLRKRLYNN